MLELIRPKRSRFFPVIVQDTIEMRPPHVRDYACWVALRLESHAHLTAWEDDWQTDELSRSSYDGRRKLFNREARRARAIALHVFIDRGQTLIGGATLTNIRYGSARAATLGYWIGAPYIERGYGSKTVDAICVHAFDRLDLNRIEAACQIDNGASIAVLKRCGFSHEGTGRDYLMINGSWRDHHLYALTARDHRGTTDSAVQY